MSKSAEGMSCVTKSLLSDPYLRAWILPMSWERVRERKSPVVTDWPVMVKKSNRPQYCSRR